MKRPFIGHVKPYNWLDGDESTAGIALKAGHKVLAHLTPSEAYALADTLVDLAESMTQPPLKTIPPHNYTHEHPTPTTTTGHTTPPDGTPPPQTTPPTYHDQHLPLPPTQHHLPTHLPPTPTPTPTHDNHTYDTHAHHDPAPAHHEAATTQTKDTHNAQQ